MNNQLKADKDRVLTELNFIKEEYFRAPEFALEELESFGFDISTDGRISIKTPGGYFRFKIENIERVILNVEIYYPENLNVDVREEDCGLVSDVVEDNLDALENLRSACRSGNEDLMNLFRSELDKVLARKEALIHA